MDVASRVLIASVSHGHPPNQFRPERAIELGRALLRAGLDVEQLLCLERDLEARDRRRFLSLEEAGRLTVLPERGRARRYLRRLAQLVGLAAARRADRCPAGLRRGVARHAASQDLVVLQGARLAPLVGELAGRVPVVLDLPCWEPALRERQRGLGRQDALESQAPAALPSLDGARALILPSELDRRAAELAGLEVPLRVVPPVAVELAPVEDIARPPIILIPGSDTIANLDGIRWFRRRVLPRVRGAVPGCRLRIVGECSRHLSPGADAERCGFVEDLGPHYRAAAIVALPFRLGGGLRRGVEALSEGKVLAVPAQLARSLGLDAEAAIVGDDEETLAGGLVKILRSDSERRRREAGALDAGRAFEEGRAVQPLLELLGLGVEVEAS